MKIHMLVAGISSIPAAMYKRTRRDPAYNIAPINDNCLENLNFNKIYKQMIPNSSMNPVTMKIAFLSTYPHLNINEVRKQIVGELKI
jgi:hypothetical protein